MFITLEVNSECHFPLFEQGSCRVICLMVNYFYSSEDSDDEGGDPEKKEIPMVPEVEKQPPPVGMMELFRCVVLLLLLSRTGYLTRSLAFGRVLTGFNAGIRPDSSSRSISSV